MLKKIFPSIVVTIVFTATVLGQSNQQQSIIQTNKTEKKDGCCAHSNTEFVEKHSVIMQLSSNDTLVWKGLMNNLKNLKAGWGDSLAIEVVAHGPGIEMLMLEKTTQQMKIASFKKMGVVFVACENTMREKNISKDKIIQEAGFVKMGIGEIILKQEKGWSYIKVGF